MLRSSGRVADYDIRLIGRDVTIVLNGKTLIDRKEVEGLTPLEKAGAKSANDAMSLSLMGLPL